MIVLSVLASYPNNNRKVFNSFLIKKSHFDGELTSINRIKHKLLQTYKIKAFLPRFAQRKSDEFKLQMNDPPSITHVTLLDYKLFKNTLKLKLSFIQYMVFVALVKSEF